MFSALILCDVIFGHPSLGPFVMLDKAKWVFAAVGASGTSVLLAPRGPLS